MFDKYGTILQEGNRVVVAAEDINQEFYFGKYNVLEIKFCEFSKQHLVLVDHGAGDWVLCEQVIYLQDN